MNLILQNRSDQHSTLHFTWPDGRPGVCKVAARGEGTIRLDDGTGTSANLAFFNASVPVILDHLARYGVVEAAGADRFDAARNPQSPPWKGVVYRLDGAP